MGKHDGGVAWKNCCVEASRPRDRQEKDSAQSCLPAFMFAIEQRKIIETLLLTRRWINMKIPQGQIVSEALALLDERGLDQLSMRTLAERLGVKAPALYWHVADKSELINQMAKSFYVRAYEEAPQSRRWREWLIGFGRAFRAALLSHRDSARICALANPEHGHAKMEIERLATPLEAAGLQHRAAVSYQSCVVAYTLGWTVMQQSEAVHDDVEIENLLRFDESFEAGLAAMVGGFANVRAEVAKKVPALVAKKESRRRSA
ncbi:TetR/AcrR family transcriptional regulator C-terminal domain-containing protein [Paraburkholderia sediminicola]|uniref:TetR/AcrR family transcriptional regulator C-terminal domain-containing protein n=1 Tax=Paraburkholderia sediminicola TaxID=458836 RepID=UPI0038B77D87